MRQHLEAHDPLTESILKTCEKEEKEEEKGGMSLLSQVTQICVVVIKGMQGYRNTVSETSWSNCRGKDEEFSSPVQYEHFLLWAKELYLWRQRRFSQQMIQMLDCSAQWDECRNLNAISLTLPGWATCHHNSEWQQHPVYSTAAFIWVERTFVKVLSSGNDRGQVILASVFLSIQWGESWSSPHLNMRMRSVNMWEPLGQGLA